MNGDEMAPEFSRPVAVDSLGPVETVIEVVARPEERAALARRFGLVAIDRLAAVLRVKPITGAGVVRLRGSFTADVVQNCVVTLTPFAARVEDSFELYYGEDASGAGGRAAIEISLEGDDPPDPIVGGAIDVGEAVAEHLSLALDPFPRLPGASLEGQSADFRAVVEARRDNPFAALTALKGKRD